MNDQSENPSSLCLVCQYEISNVNDFFVKTLTYDDNVIIYTLIDENIKINNKPLVFNFAVKIEELG